MIIEIGYTVSNKYIGLLSVSIASILENSNLDEKFNFYVLNSDITDENKRKIESLRYIKNFDIFYISMNNDDFEDMADGISVVSNYRIKIASLVPNIDKILFLDSDIIILKSLAELYHTDLNNNYIAAAVDPGVNLQYQYTIDDKEKFPDRRFNTGVMLINLKKWREDSIEEKIMNGIKWYSTKYKNWPDQNVLNMICKDNIFELDTIYNFAPILYQQGWYENQHYIFNNINDIVILHFAGVPKPWESRDVLKTIESLKYPVNVESSKLDKASVFLDDIFWRYARKTPYYEDFMFQYTQLELIERINVLEKKCSISSYFKYIKYRFLCNFAFGKRRTKYLKKKKELKSFLGI